MRLLYLTHKPVFPIVDGGCKAMYQFLQCLFDNHYSIKHICLSTQKHMFDLSQYPDDLAKKIHPQSCSINTSLNYLAAIKHLFINKSYNVSRFDTPIMHEKINEELLQQKYDLVILESIFLSPYIETIRKSSRAKILIRTHNVEYTLWEQQAKKTSSIIKKWYLKKLAKDLKKAELEALQKVDLVATITDEDEHNFRQAGITTSIFTLPVTLKPSTLPINSISCKICFIGAMNWQPNREALNWLIDEIFPILKHKIPNIELHIAGSFIGDLLQENKDEAIVVHGFVNDSTTFLTSHGILVLPIKSGSGVRIKLLEAMSLGVPCITTSKGAEGIRNKDAVFIAETTEAFIDGITTLLTSEFLCQKLSQNAKTYIQHNHSTELISNLIRKEIEGN